MSGPTVWQQILNTIQAGAQTITANTETVIATLGNVFSRSVGAPITLNGYCQFAVQAATTDLKVRIRADSLTGTVLNTQPAEWTGTAATVSQDQLSIVAQDPASVEYYNKTYVLTIQATAAGASWNVNMATLQALI